MIRIAQWRRRGSIAVAALLAISCAPEGAPSPRRPTVAVSIAPQAYLIDRMAGGLVDVRTLVAAGRSPEDYEPLPQELVALDGATHYFSIGMPFERVWLPRLAEIQPEIEIVAMHAELLAGSADPHYWTDPQKALKLAHAAYEPLLEIFPGPKEAIFRNYLGLVEELTLLDTRIERLMTAREKKRFLVYHPAWSHFASRYGLEQVAFERDGKEPGARYVAELMTLCRENGVRTLFVQPQHSPEQARRFAGELGATLAVVDPLSGDYSANLWRVAQLIAGELW